MEDYDYSVVFCCLVVVSRLLRLASALLLLVCVCVCVCVSFPFWFVWFVHLCVSLRLYDSFLCHGTT